MAGKVRIRAKANGSTVEVKALIKHPMETGQRKDKKTGKKIPAHFIQTVKATSGGRTVFEAYWSGAISKNPYLAFQYEGKAGDELSIHCVDNKGKEYSGKATVK